MREDKFIGEIVRADQARIKIFVREYFGEIRLDVRLFFKTEDGEFIPTKKGVVIPAEDFDEFMELMKKAQKELAA